MEYYCYVALKAKIPLYSPLSSPNFSMVCTLYHHFCSRIRRKSSHPGRGCAAVCHIQPVKGDILYHGSPPYRCRRFSWYLRSSFSSTAPMTSSSHLTIRHLYQCAPRLIGRPPYRSRVMHKPSLLPVCKNLTDDTPDLL